MSGCHILLHRWDGLRIERGLWRCYVLGWVSIDLHPSAVAGRVSSLLAAFRKGGPATVAITPQVRR